MKSNKEKLKGQIETGLNTYAGARIIKERKLRNNKREHRKREREMQYKDTTRHDKKTTTSATRNSESMQMPDTQSNEM